MYGGQRSISDAVFLMPSTLAFETGPPTGLELAKEARPPSCKPQVSTSSTLPQHWKYTHLSAHPAF